MDWTSYLFSFKGRINRAKYWLAGLIILFWMLFLAALTAGAIGLFGGKMSFGFSIDDLFKAIDPATYHAIPLSRLPVLLIKIAGTALFLWVYFAAAIKRLHDRDKSGWWIVPFFILPGLCSQFEDRLPDSTWIMPLVLASSALYLWGFIELGCLRGTPRANQFGSDPLGKIQTRPRSDRDIRPRPTQGWDQQSEIELVPHKAGPPPVWRVKRDA
ncbi:hypothetical protein UP09_24955 [Bradyrhizobium sp. LTSP885]|uniref:DUF805 domain-containing protein n=1 Tax=Bradyrhizobium sp. LTSP885 TaxID=1619232 RepID=UPI0005CB48EB|nr:DUF805 domain-containing protein [Bradyrhizobium sp. LTSP885]KJC39133.1 hypothetical protein UP09_24955 [Bradyrhizobium sp. LTSP885]